MAIMLFSEAEINKEMKKLSKVSQNRQVGHLNHFVLIFPKGSQSITLPKKFW